MNGTIETTTSSGAETARGARATHALSDEHHTLRRAAWLLVGGCAVWMVAGAPPALEDVYNADSDQQAFDTIADHANLYRWTNVAMVVGTLIAVAGFWGLNRILRAGRDRQLARAAVVVAVVAAVAWMVEVAIRLTATVSRARDVAAGTAEPASFPGGNEPLFLIVLVGAAASITTLAWAAARARLVWPPVAALVTLACAVSVAVAVPITAYVFGVLPLGIGMLVRSHRIAHGAQRSAS